MVNFNPSFIFKTMVVDDLVMQEARASTATVFTYFSSWNVVVKAKVSLIVSECTCVFLRTDRCITILLLSWGIPARYKRCLWRNNSRHYCDVIMGPMASKITSLTIVYSTIYSGADQRKHQRSASLDFVRGIPRSPVNSPHKGPVTRKMFPFDDVIMEPRLTVPSLHSIEH